MAAEAMLDRTEQLQRSQKARFALSRTGDRSRLAVLVLIGLCILSLAAILVSSVTGASDASLLHAILALTSLDGDIGLTARERIIIFDIRLPRVVMGFVIGGSLAASGVVMQGLFRNPLADPGLVGISAGASLGAVVMIVLGGTIAAPVANLLGVYALPVAAFIGGLISTFLLYRIATRHGQTSVVTMLLGGIALGAMMMAVTGLLIYMADDKQLRDLTFWSMGSLAGASWTKIYATLPIIAAALLAMIFLSRGLNAITLGEAAAFHMGVSVQRLKIIAIVAVAAATGASVAISGGIAFVGLVVPHILRMTIGPDHRFLLPASTLAGGSLLILADMVARTIVVPAELPIGIITAAAGSPFFLWLLLHRRSQLGL